MMNVGVLPRCGIFPRRADATERRSQGAVSAWVGANPAVCPPRGEEAKREVPLRCRQLGPPDRVHRDGERRGGQGPGRRRVIWS